MSEEKQRVFCFFRESEDRMRFLNEENSRYRSYLFQGSERYFEFGWYSECNLSRPPVRWVRYLGDFISRMMFRIRGYGGDFGTIFMNLRAANRADVIYSTVDTVGIPLALFKWLKLIRKPLVYMSIGLCERLDNMSDSWMKRLQIRSLRSCSVVAGYGWEEVRRLKKLLGESCSVRFVPYGIDPDVWCPLNAEKEVDVLSLGVDTQRDFIQLRTFAERNPERSVRIITSTELHKELMDMPANVTISGLIPLNKVAETMAAARVIALPVKENTYSGATTTLLQSMAMGLPVAVSRVGAIIDGYDLRDGENCRLIDPDDSVMWADVLEQMLTHPATVEKMGACAQRHVREKYTWERYLENVTNLFEQAKKAV